MHFIQFFLIVCIKILVLTFSMTLFVMNFIYFDVILSLNKFG